MATDPLEKSLIKAWRDLQRRRQTEDNSRRAALRETQRDRRRTVVATVKSLALSVSDRRSILANLRLHERRELRDLDDAIRRERTEAARADAHASMISAEDWRAMAPEKPLTPDDLVRLFNSDDDLDGLLQVARVREALSKVRDRGSDSDRLRVAKSLVGIRPGRPRNSPEARDAKKMKLLKSKIQRAMTRLRRQLRPTAQTDRRAYQRAIEIDVLAPSVGWDPAKQRRIAAELSNPAMTPVQAAARVVAAEFRVRPWRVARLGKIRLERPKRESGGRPARRRQRATRRSLDQD